MHNLKTGHKKRTAQIGQPDARGRRVATSAADILSHARGALGEIAQQGAKQNDLLQRFRARIDPVLAAHVTGARLDKRCLTLYCDSAAFAARLRLDLGESDQALLGEFAAERWQVRIAPGGGRKK